MRTLFPEFTGLYAKFDRQLGRWSVCVSSDTSTATAYGEDFDLTLDNAVADLRRRAMVAA